MTSSAYTAAYNEVKNLGGATGTQRTEEQTFVGIFWAYEAPQASARLRGSTTRSRCKLLIRED